MRIQSAVALALLYFPSPSNIKRHSSSDQTSTPGFLQGSDRRRVGVIRDAGAVG